MPAASLAGEGRLDQLPGIGKDLAGKIGTILETGTLPLLRELIEKTPESLAQMLRIPGLGPKRAKQIYDTLHIATLADLETAARSGHLRHPPASRRQPNRRSSRDWRHFAGTRRIGASMKPTLMSSTGSTMVAGMRPCLLPRVVL